MLVSSTAARRGEANHAHYAASKGALHGLAKSLASELGPSGIRTNVVAPGWVDTPMTADELSSAERREAIRKTIPLGRIPGPEDIAYPILFLASDWAKHINGAILDVNGGEGDRVRIGRAPDNDVRIDDLSLSREHAELQNDMGSWSIQDRGSRNGTQVNGRTITGLQALRDNDKLRLGNITLLFRHPERTVKFRRDTIEEALPEGTLAIRAQDLLKSVTDDQPESDHQLLKLLSRTTAMLIADMGTEEFHDKVLADTCDIIKADGGALLGFDDRSGKLVVKATKKVKGGGSIVLSKKSQIY